MSPPPGAEGLFAHLAPLPLHLRKKLHLSSDGNLETFHEFKTSMYNSFMKLVPELILWVVSLEYSVLYSDTDVVLLSDPFVVTRDLARDYDWLMSLDSYDARGKDPCQYIIACGGILYAKHSPFAMSILQDWARSVYNTTYLKKGNQRAYNDVLVKHNISKMGILPCSMFPNGGRFNEVHGGVTWRKSQKVSPVMVHNNWIIGKNNKIETFKRWGLWIEDLEDPSLPITPKMDEKLERITSKMSITERFTFKKS